jgi:hypothetical protein
MSDRVAPEPGVAAFVESVGARDRSDLAHARSGFEAACLAGLAVALTFAAVLKPILWDEEVYFQFARHIAQHPLDPYGAHIWVLGQTVDGLHLQWAPPVLIYWWAGAMALFGPQVSLTAIGLFPFAAVYTIAFHSLARRFAPALALPLTVMATLSAWGLVTISYMFDFPAVSLGLAAVALFFAGATRGARGLVVAAGIVAGLALETKYNAAAALGAMLLWGLLARRFVDAALVVAVAILVFCALEWLIYLKYGHSHFLINFISAPQTSNDYVRQISRLRGLFYAAFQNGGPLAIGALLLLPIALRSHRNSVAANTAFAVAASGLAAAGLDRVLGHVIPGATPERMPMMLTMSGLLGLALVLQGARLIAVPERRAILFGGRDGWFLLAWLAIEIAVYFAMSPFPAARRMGEIVAVTLLFTGRAVVLARPQAARGMLVGVAVAINAVCGLTMLAISLVDGRNVEATADAAAAFMRANPGGESWQLSTLAFAHYFDASGVRRVDLATTTLRPDDLLATDITDPDRMQALEAAGLRPLATVRAGINLGVSVSTSFYRAQDPWFAAADTRPAIVVLRAAKATPIPVH